MRRLKIRNFGMATLALTLLSMHKVAGASDLVAMVDLQFIRATDQPAAYLCLGERDEDCVVWATVNVYKARIRKIFSGTETRKTMFVTFGKHALAERNLRGIIATMNKREAKEPTDPQYHIVDWGQKRELVCFGRRENDSEGFELRKDGEGSLTCYDTK